MTTLLEIFKTMEYGPAPESPAGGERLLEEHDASSAVSLTSMGHAAGREISSLG